MSDQQYNNEMFDFFNDEINEVPDFSMFPIDPQLKNGSKEQDDLAFGDYVAPTALMLGSPSEDKSSMVNEKRPRSTRLEHLNTPLVNSGRRPELYDDMYASV